MTRSIRCATLLACLLPASTFAADSAADAAWLKHGLAQEELVAVGAHFENRGMRCDQHGVVSAKLSILIEMKQER